MLSENEWKLSSKSLSVMIRCKIRMKLPQRVQRELRDASPDFRCLPPAVGLQLRLPPSSLGRCVTLPSTMAKGHCPVYLGSDGILRSSFRSKGQRRRCQLLNSKREKQFGATLLNSAWW